MVNIIIKSDERNRETARTLSEYGIAYDRATVDQREMAEQFNSDFKPFNKELRRMEDMR